MQEQKQKQFQNVEELISRSFYLRHFLIFLRDESFDFPLQFRKWISRYRIFPYKVQLRAVIHWSTTCLIYVLFNIILRLNKHVTSKVKILRFNAKQWRRRLINHISVTHFNDVLFATIQSRLSELWTSELLFYLMEYNVILKLKNQQQVLWPYLVLVVGGIFDEEHSLVWFIHL